MDLFRILGNENRRRMVELLSERPMYVSELAEELGIGQKAVLDHLRVLSEEGLIEESRGKHNRRYLRIGRSFHAEFFVSPSRTRSAVTELKGRERESSELPESRESLEEMLEELKSRREEVLEKMIKMLKSEKGGRDSSSKDFVRGDRK